MRVDLAVVGAGVAGFAVGLCAAKLGMSVALVEAGAAPLPLLRGFSRAGVHFDAAFHYAGALGSGEALMRRLDFLDVQRRLTPTRLSETGFDRYVLGDSLPFAWPQGPEAALDALGAAFPKERDGLARFTGAMRRAYFAHPLLNPMLPAGSPIEPDDLKGRSLAELLAATIADPKLHAILASQTLLHGVEPERCPFCHHARIAYSYWISAHGVRGGGAGLAGAFEAAAGEAGIRIVLNRTVVGLDRAPDGRPNQLRLAPNGTDPALQRDMETLACNAVVHTAHPALLFDYAPCEAFSPAYRKRIAGLCETPGPVMLFAKRKTARTDLAGANRVYLPKARFSGLTGPESPIFAAQAGEKNALGATFLRLAETGSAPKAETAEGVLRDVARLDPDLAADCEILTISDAADYRRWVRSPHGSTYGAAHTLDAVAPAPRTRVPGLYLAGQGTAAPGLMGAVLSGFMAVDALTNGRLEQDFRRWANA